jgi:hypothetical protein
VKSWPRAVLTAQPRPMVAQGLGFESVLVVSFKPSGHRPCINRIGCLGSRSDFPSSSAVRLLGHHLQSESPVAVRNCAPGWCRQSEV